jgi:hypothetical protein
MLILWEGLFSRLVISNYGIDIGEVRRLDDLLSLDKKIIVST